VPSALPCGDCGGYFFFELIVSFRIVRTRESPSGNASWTAFIVILNVALRSVI